MAHAGRRLSSHLERGSMLFMTKVSALAVGAILLGNPSAALAATTEAHFVPEVTKISWDGSTATVTFEEVEVELETDTTTISTRVTADLDAVCTNGESTIRIHRTASSLRTSDYLISLDGTVPGIARVPLKVSGIPDGGFKCVVERISLTAELEDFWTGATHTHKVQRPTPPTRAGQERRWPPRPPRC
jgi:hypothetical protein